MNWRRPGKISLDFIRQFVYHEKDELMQNWELSKNNQEMKKIAPLFIWLKGGRCMEIFPAVLQAVPGDDFTVYAYCNDGAVRLLDAKPLIARGGVFAPLSDRSFFRERLTVLNDTVAWDMTGDRDASACVDVDPFTIFEDCAIVNDPLENVK